MTDFCTVIKTNTKETDPGMYPYFFNGSNKIQKSCCISPIKTLIKLAIYQEIVRGNPPSNINKKNWNYFMYVDDYFLF